MRRIDIIPVCLRHPVIESADHPMESAVDSGVRQRARTDLVPGGDEAKY